MSEKTDSVKSFAAVLVRGTMSCRAKVRNTLSYLGFTRKNQCIIIPANITFKGMLNLSKDYITWGAVSSGTVELVLSKRGETGKGKLSDEFVSKNSSYKSVKDLASAIAEGKASLDGVKGAKAVIRLNPPKKGFGSIKKPRPKGALGFRKEGMDALLQSMI